MSLSKDGIPPRMSIRPLKRLRPDSEPSTESSSSEHSADSESSSSEPLSKAISVLADAPGEVPRTHLLRRGVQFIMPDGSSDADRNLALAVASGMQFPTMEGRQYAMWLCALDEHLFRKFGCEFPTSQEMVGYKFFMSHTQCQLPVVSSLGGWADQEAISALRVESVNSTDPSGKQKRRKKPDVQDKLVEASKRIPDLTRTLHQVRITGSTIEQHPLFEIIQSRNILIVEVKPLQAVAIENTLMAAFEQAFEQAQHTFDEDKGLNYLGLIVACQDNWVYHEFNRTDIRPAAWRTPRHPKDVALDLEPVMNTPKAELTPSPHHLISPRPGSDSDYDAKDYVFRMHSKALRQQVRRTTPVNTRGFASGRLLTGRFDAASFQADFLTPLLNETGKLYFTLQDSKGVSKKAFELIAAKLKEKNADICWVGTDEDSSDEYNDHDVQDGSNGQRSSSVQDPQDNNLDGDDEDDDFDDNEGEGDEGDEGNESGEGDEDDVFEEQPESPPMSQSEDDMLADISTGMTPHSSRSSLAEEIFALQVISTTDAASPSVADSSQVHTNFTGHPRAREESPIPSVNTRVSRGQQEITSANIASSSRTHTRSPASRPATHGHRGTSSSTASRSRASRSAYDANSNTAAGTSTIRDPRDNIAGSSRSNAPRTPYRQGSRTGSSKQDENTLDSPDPLSSWQ